MSNADDIQSNWFHRMHRGEVPKAPVQHLLGASIQRVDVEAGELDVTYHAADNFRNPAGTVQGGMLGAMLDDLVAGVVDATLKPGEVVVTLNLNLSYLRPSQAGSVQGEARIERRGRDVCHVNARLLQQGKAVANATATCMVVRPRT